MLISHRCKERKALQRQLGSFSEIVLFADNSASARVFVSLSMLNLFIMLSSSSFARNQIEQEEQQYRTTDSNQKGLETERERICSAKQTKNPRSG